MFKKTNTDVNKAEAVFNHLKCFRIIVSSMFDSHTNR